MKKLAPTLTSLAFLLVFATAHAQPQVGCVDYARFSHWASGSNRAFESLAATDWYLYGVEFGSLQVFDLHDPDTPKPVGSIFTGGQDSRVALSGHLAYVVSAGGSASSMKIVDVSEPSAPMLNGSVNLPDIASNLALSGKYACVVTNWASPTRSSLQVIDVSNPNAPAIVGHLDLNLGTLTGVSAAGSYAYVSLNDNLLVVSISNPTQPAVVSGLQLNGYCNAIRVVGSHAYAVSDNGLQIVDVSSPTAPTIVGAVAAPGIDVAVAGSLACVLGANIVSVIDISSPSAPVLIGNVDVRAYNAPTTIAASGSHAYVAPNRFTPELGHATLHAIALSAMSTPPPVGVLSGVGGKVAAQGSHAYVLSPTALQVIDVSAPSTPTLAGSVSLPSYCQAISVAGPYAYVAILNQYPATGGHLKVIDVSNPAAPAVVGNVDMGSPCDVATDGSYVFVGDDTGLKIIDVSTPTAPAIIRQVSIGAVDLMAMVDSRVYLYTPGSSPWTENLSVINVADPEYPTLAWQEEELSGVGGVAITGSFMYTCIGHIDSVPILYVRDITAPDGPPTDVTHVYPKGTGRLTAAGDFLYLSLYAGMAHLIDVSIPSKPRFVGEVGPCGPNLAVAGPYIYTAPGDFYVLHAQCAQHTTGVADTRRSAAFSVLAFPNPFNPATKIEYDVPSTGVVTVSVYDVQGRKVASLVDHQRTIVGTHVVNWDGQTDRGAAAASGIYFVRVEQYGKAVSKKITLLK